jgi:YihY family inner membrane protein
MSASGSPLAGILQRLGRQRLRDVVAGTVEGVGRNDLLTFGSAVAFQVAKSIPPLLMFALALAGWLGFADVWSEKLAPELARHTSREFYALADRAARAALTNKEGFWLTTGLALTLWEVSGGVRAVMTATSRIYGAEDRRSARRRYLTSFALSVAAVALPLLAVASMQAGGRVGGLAAAVARWPVAAALLFALVWLLLRFAPAEPRADRWVTFGSVVCVAAWLLTSAAFGLYATGIADYGSIFSSLAVLFIALIYLYVSACAFLVGVQVDAVVRQGRALA